jgi:hypothetical protein
MMTDLANKTKEKYEDVNDKLDFLRRIEIKFNMLVEWRDSFTDFEQERGLNKS